MKLFFLFQKNYKKELINHNFDFFTYPIKFIDFDSCCDYNYLDKLQNYGTEYYKPKINSKFNF